MLADEESSIAGDSLPSNSIFVRHLIEEEPSITGRRSFDSTNNNNNNSSNNANSSKSNTPTRSIRVAKSPRDSFEGRSPPPPPPPTIVFDDIPLKLANSTQKVNVTNTKLLNVTTPTTVGTSKSGGDNSSKSSTGSSSSPRPFLKRGSRKEPSALNRLNKSSPIEVAASNRPSDGYKTYNSGSVYKEKSITTTNSSSSNKSTSNFSFMDDLSNELPIKSHLKRDIDEGTGEYSISLQTIRNNELKQLDEFALLEKELEMNNIISPSSARSTARAENTFNSSKNYSVVTPKYTFNDHDANGDLDDDDIEEYYQFDTTPVVQPPTTSATKQTYLTASFDNQENEEFEEENVIDYEKYTSRVTTSAIDDDGPAKRSVPMNWGMATKPNTSDYEGDMLGSQFGGQHSFSYGGQYSGQYGGDSDYTGISERNGYSKYDHSDSSSRGRPQVPSIQSGHFHANKAGTSSKKKVSYASKLEERRSPTKPVMNPGSNYTTNEEALLEKAKELEKEMSIYKQENATLKQLKKQQESALQEVMRQRAEMNKWVIEEKQKTESYCEELKQAALKERRAAAKYARDARQKAGGLNADGTVQSVRKDKELIDGLQATIQKLKIDYEQGIKRYKVNEKRLHQLAKENSDKNDELNRKILVLEEEKLAIWQYLDHTGVRLPNNIAKLRPSAKKSNSSHAASSGAPATFSRNKVDGSYGEEVFVEDTSGKVASLYVTESFENTNFDSEYSQRNKRASRSSNASVSSSYASDAYDNGDTRASWEGISTTSSYSSQIGNYFGLNETNAISSGSVKETVAAPSRSPPRAAKETGKGSGKELGYSRDDSRSNDAPASVSVSVEPAIPASRTEELLPDGRKVIKYRNGTTKEIHPDGSSVVHFLNGDKKKSAADTGIIVYYYAQAETVHTTFPDGLEVYEFPNKQVEKHYKDGNKEIIFPDHTKKIIRVNGVNESIFPDGIRVIEYPDGSKDIITDGVVQHVAANV